MAKNSKKKSDKKLPKVAICVPAYKWLPIMFVTGLLDIFQYIKPRFNSVTIIQDVLPLDEARNRCVQLAIDSKCEYILFLDNDNMAPPSALDKLYKTMIDLKADLVTGLYVEKVKPYYGVLRSWNKDWGFRRMEIAEKQYGQAVKIGGCGLGCCLIKTEVFKKLPKPWFYFQYEEEEGRTTQISEDLFLCRNMNLAGMKLYCDTKVVAPHLGAVADMHEHWSFKKLRENVEAEREELTTDIIEFTGNTEIEVKKSLPLGSILMANEWEKKNPKTNKQMRKFYKETKNYLPDLLLWHFTSRRKFDLDLLVNVQERWKPKNILDVGSGIGQNSIMLARAGFDVTIADLDGYTQDFARFRFAKHSVPFKEWLMDKQPAPPDKKYDMILLFDVLEHIPEGEFEDFVNKLLEVKHDKTVVLLTHAFGKTSAHPMHLKATKMKKKLMEELLGEEIHAMRVSA